MRLLNTTTLAFEEFYDTQQVKCRILSHCWSQDRADPEVTLQAHLSGSYNPEGQGWKKILRCCALSKEFGYEWTWIDTCCIDKSSSAEVSEAINSMFKWYQDSSECYVFMDDCDGNTLPRVDEFDKDERWKQGMHVSDVANIETFSKSRWFKRGWTLQELLAPRELLFYSSTDLLLGTKAELASLLSYSSGIAQEYILHPDGIRTASVAIRMSWASDRTTTRVEDIGYCLLGIFGINMPLLYGEGQNAFQRVQHEIIRTHVDLSIFAWGINLQQPDHCSILARYPSDFRDSTATYIDNEFLADIRSYSITHAGLTITTYTAMPFGHLALVLGTRASEAIVLYMTRHIDNRWYRARLRTSTRPRSPLPAGLRLFMKAVTGSSRTIHAAIFSHGTPQSTALYDPYFIEKQRHRWRLRIFVGLIVSTFRNLPLTAMIVSQVTVLAVADLGTDGLWPSLTALSSAVIIVTYLRLI
ncbi:hypothetical protein B0A48_08120 [Cryoendolithus antarcticus]|uniref:Uncharacterized protein n=1 Tax=Cryoendolithus antarcticus TaxID=1507870 RepID=A0A1V8T193_9PEZI|nr:hypothetical protein B0A48_08120 [Cryoendolithus antarcticus]